MDKSEQDADQLPEAVESGELTDDVLDTVSGGSGRSSALNLTVA
ncbi:MAG: hypothetical protein WCP28_13360 [Actinomycetes bacterium]